MTNLSYFFPILFVGMWILVTFIISKFGWADLAAKYKVEDTFIGSRIGIISASINSANYRNAIILKYNEEGIYLKTIFLFRLFHDPILIPWKEIKEVRGKKFLFFNPKQLIVGSPFVATITISSSTFSKFETDYLLHSISK